MSDIVAGILLALQSEDAVGSAINLGTGRVTTVDDVAQALGAGLGVHAEPERTSRYRAGDIRHCYADIGRAEKLLGFRASVRLDEGMAALIEWLAGREADDRVDTATGELVARGLAR